MRRSPIKIARLIARLNVGGPAIHVVLLTQGLNDEVMQSCLITGRISSGEADMQYFAEQHGVLPVVLPRFGREISLLGDLSTLWRVYQFFRRERPDIVHTHTAKAGTLGRLAGLLARVPILVHTFHGHVFRGYFGRFKTAYIIWAEWLLALFTDKIVVISEQQFLDLSRTYRIAPEEKFVIIPLGFDLAALFALDRSKGGPVDVRSKVCVIGIIGRMVTVKNHELAINLLERMDCEKLFVGAIQLVMVGDGPLRPRLERRVVEARLEDRVIFTGWQHDLAKVYEGLDLVLLTSINEGTPVALIEAMAAGLPFVATRVGGVPDLMIGKGRKVCGSAGRVLYVIYDNGILVESGDVAGVSAAVAYLAGRVEIRKGMGEEGRRFVRNQYSKERLLDDVRALYLGLIRKNIPED